MPTEPTIAAYIRNHTYLCPLVRPFFFCNVVADHDHWSKPLSAARDEITSFTTRIAIALPTVVTTHTPDASTVRPYLLVEGGDLGNLALAGSLQRYIDNGAEAAEQQRLSKLLVPQLVEIIHVRLKPNGHYHATSKMNKPALIEMIAELNRDFIAERFKPLQPDEALLVNNYVNAPEKIVDLDRANVVEIQGTPVTLDDFATLAGSQNSLSPVLMDAMMLLFRDRDAELSDLHKLTNERDRHYKRREHTGYVIATHAEVRIINDGE